MYISNGRGESFNGANSRNILTWSQHFIEDIRFAIKSGDCYAVNSLLKEAFPHKAVLLIIFYINLVNSSYDGPISLHKIWVMNYCTRTLEKSSHAFTPPRPSLSAPPPEASLPVLFLEKRREGGRHGHSKMRICKTGFQIRAKPWSLFFKI